MDKTSIITVAYNSKNTIRDCIESIRNQDKPIEHIIIDGGSTDGTLDIISEYHSSMAKIISEPDNGMYDALNKGLILATGDVIGILHGDDCFMSPKVISQVSRVFEDREIDGCYGDLVYVENSLKRKSGRGEGNEPGDSFPYSRLRIVRYWRSGEYDRRKFYWGWMPPHPTFFVRRSVYEKYGLFNLNMGTAADYELMLRFLLKHQISCKYIPEILVNMRVGGMSNASLGNRLRANRMDRKAWEVNGLKPYPWTLWMKPVRKMPQWFRRPNS